MKGVAPSTLLLRASLRRSEVRSCKLRLASRLLYGENSRTRTPACAGMTEKKFESTNSQLLSLTLIVQDSLQMSASGCTLSTGPVHRWGRAPRPSRSSTIRWPAS